MIKRQAQEQLLQAPNHPRGYRRVLFWARMANREYESHSYNHPTDFFHYSCRSCTSFASWASMTKAQTSNQPAAQRAASGAVPEHTDCPPDVEELGRSTWTLLHGMTATYPTSAPPTTQSKTKQFLSLFSELYPCWVCAEDFQDWMREPGNEPKVEGQDVFGFWMCRAHNAVNVKLGKPEFDCGLWKQRWKDGWKDGSCN